MTRPVSIVIPTLGDVPLLERALTALRDEVRERNVEDQILVVDDSGYGALRGALDLTWPEVRVLTRKQNGGFAAAAFEGAQAADYRLLLLLQSDVVVRPGTLTALVEALQDERVYAAAPRVLVDGRDDREAAQRITVEDGRLALLADRDATAEAGLGELEPIAFGAGCALLVRREEFVAQGGFDQLFAPLWFEDVDLGISAWRQGREVVLVPAAVVEHHAGGTVDARVPEALVRAARERNRLLVHWKHLSTRREAHDHMVALWRDALDAGLCGRREELVHMALALGELEAVHASRAELAGASATLADVLAQTAPGATRRP